MEVMEGGGQYSLLGALTPHQPGKGIGYVPLFEIDVEQGIGKRSQ
jgi:hypothetical protein